MKQMTIRIMEQMAASAYASSLTSCVMYIGTVLTLSLIARVAPVSPRDLVKARIPPAMTDDLTMGMRIFLNAWKGFAPRVMAISSHSGLTSSMAPIMFLTTRGYVNEMCPRMTRTRAMESLAPKLPQNSARENPSAVVGMISGTLTNPSSMFASFPLRCLAMYSESGTPRTISTMTATPATSIDVPVELSSIP